MPRRSLRILNRHAALALQNVEEGSAVALEARIAKMPEILTMPLAEGGALIHHIARTGQADLLQALVERYGVPYNSLDAKGNQPLDWAEEEMETDSLVRVKGLLHQYDDLRIIALIQHGDLAGVQAEIDRGMDVNDRLLDGTLMHYAALYGQVNIIYCLAQQRAVIDAIDVEFGQQPMHWAARGNQVGAMKCLRALGANVDAHTEDDCSPAHVAAFCNNVDALVWLQAQQADMRYATLTEKASPLHYAAQAGAVDAIQMLVRQGVDLFAKDSFNRSAADIAKGAENEAAFVILSRAMEIYKQHSKQELFVAHNFTQQLLEDRGGRVSQALGAMHA
jgi:ankyrin repeat protein